MHPTEYNRYLSLRDQSVLPPPGDLDTQQSVVSTIKSEDLEFVEVDQDEMNDDLQGEMGDSYDSSDYFENIDNLQTYSESAATSTTRISNKRPTNGIRIKYWSIYNNWLG